MERIIESLLSIATVATLALGGLAVGTGVPRILTRRRVKRAVTPSQMRYRVAGARFRQ